MLFGNPVKGTVHPDARYYAAAEGAILRAAGPPRVPLVTHDFGPSTELREPEVVWPGGEWDIYGRTIPAATYPKFHRGIDISTGGTGDAVTASAAGTVTASGFVSGWGGACIVILNHGRDAQGHLWETIYVHLQSESVTNGQKVAEGLQIGKLGNTGVSSGAHLHWGVRKDGKYVAGWQRLRQNTSVDPDAPVAPTPPQEDDVNIATYIPGHIATIKPTTNAANIRGQANDNGAVLRQVEVGTTESRKVIGWEKGELVAGSDQWLCWWNADPPGTEPARLEYVHSSNVDSVVAPVVDCAAQVKAATDPLNARITGMKTKTAAFAADIAND